MENSIEEAIKIMEHWIEYEKNNKEKINRADELINIQETILSAYKRVLKENEILKEEKEQAWEEWNNLEQGSYGTEQKLKQQIKELQKENEELNNRCRNLDKEAQAYLEELAGDNTLTRRTIKQLQEENEELKEERQIVGIPVRNKRDRRIGIVLHQWESGSVAVLESINPRVINTHDSWNTLEIVTDEVKQTQTKCETIPVSLVKDKIEHYQKLQHNYIEKYDEINEGLQAMISALKELLGKE